MQQQLCIKTTSLCPGWTNYLYPTSLNNAQPVQIPIFPFGFNAKNEASVLKQELAALLLEKEYFKTYYNETNEVIAPYRPLFRHNSETVMALWLYYQRMAQKDEGIRLTYKLKNLLRYGIICLSFYNNSPEKVIAFFQRLFWL